MIHALVGAGLGSDESLVFTVREQESRRGSLFVFVRSRQRFALQNDRSSRTARSSGRGSEIRDS